MQVCSTGVDEQVMKGEFEKLRTALSQGASIASPPLPLTTIVIQVCMFCPFYLYKGF